MSGPGQDQDGWAQTLHELWRSALDAPEPARLAGLVLPVLRGLPGVTAARQVPADAPDASLRAGGLAFQVTPERGVHDRLTQVGDVIAQAARMQQARRRDDDEQVRDALLAEASVQMDAVLDPAQTMHRVARMAVPAIADGCLVLLHGGRRLSVGSAVHVDMHRLAALLREPSTQTALTALAASVPDGTPPPAAVAAVGARSVRLQELRARGRMLGVLLFLYDRDDDLVPQEGFLRDLAHRAALAIDNSTLYEERRREVVTLQQHLLPERLPSPPGLELAASYVVGDRVLDVGGDFYDAVVRADGVTAAVIGDVCGRGAGAAALTGMARHTLGSLLQEGVSPGRALSRLNTALRRDGSWRFVTAGVALLRPGPDGIAVQWTSAGHPAPIVVRRDGPVEVGRGGGIPLSVRDQPSAGRSRLRLGPGDTLVMYTDGLTESRNAAGVMFEEEVLWEVLGRLRDTPAPELVTRLAEASKEFGVHAADDTAVLAVRAVADGGTKR